MALRRFCNGQFITLDPARPQAAEIVVEAGRIIEVSEARGPARGAEMDLGGRVAIPGPVDAHCHLGSFGMQRIREADLHGVSSLPELAARLQAHAAGVGSGDGGRWLLGRGFDQELLPGGAWPTRNDLDRISPDRPLRMIRVCGHALAANTAALQEAGLPPDARSPGFPAGVLTENDMAPIHAAVPPPGPDEWRRATEWAMEAALRAGFVGVHSLVAGAGEVRALMELHAEDRLPLRVRLQLPYTMLPYAESMGLRTGFGDEWLHLGAVKLFADGSLGARTAALLAPYCDDESTTGDLLLDSEELLDRLRHIHGAGFQACIHAIGDRALAAVLDAVEQEAATAPPDCRPPAPPRIEHASLVNPELISRMRRLGVGAAVQPQFAWSDRWLPERVGAERLPGCYAFRALDKAGIPLAGSTDCPVERLDALAAIGAALHRPAWAPGEALSLAAALKIFSEGSYAVAGRPRRLGRLQPGGFADFVVLDEDPRLVPPAEVHRIPVAMTVVGGELRYGG